MLLIASILLKLNFPLKVSGNGRGRAADDISHPSTDLTSRPRLLLLLPVYYCPRRRRGKWAFVIITQGESWMVEGGKAGSILVRKNLLLLSFLLI